MRNFVLVLTAIIIMSLNSGCGHGKVETELNNARDSIAILSKTVDSLSSRLDSISKWQHEAIDKMIVNNQFDAARQSITVFGKSFPDSTNLTNSFFDRVSNKEILIKHEKSAQAIKRGSTQGQRSGGSHMIECPYCGGSGKGPKMMDKPAPDCFWCGGRGWKFEED